MHVVSLDTLNANFQKEKTIITIEENEFEISMPGNAQITNTLLAYHVGKLLKIQLKHVQKGIARTQLPARIETISQEPLIIIDGAHNEDKMRNIAQYVQQHACGAQGKIFLIIAIGSSRAPEPILAQIVKYADHIIFTRFENTFKRCYSPNVLEQLAKPFLKPKSTTEHNLDPRTALQIILQKARKDDTVIITGSFFLAGELRQHWISEQWILNNKTSCQGGLHTHS